jgi:hypothetical protein
MICREIVSPSVAWLAHHAGLSGTLALGDPHRYWHATGKMANLRPRAGPPTVH